MKTQQTPNLKIFLICNNLSKGLGILELIVQVLQSRQLFICLYQYHKNPTLKPILCQGTDKTVFIGSQFFHHRKIKISSQRNQFELILYNEGGNFITQMTLRYEEVR